MTEFYYFFCLEMFWVNKILLNYDLRRYICHNTKQINNICKKLWIKQFELQPLIKNSEHVLLKRFKFRWHFSTICFFLLLIYLVFWFALVFLDRSFFFLKKNMICFLCNFDWIYWHFSYKLRSLIVLDEKLFFLCFTWENILWWNFFCHFMKGSKEMVFLA